MVRVYTVSYQIGTHMGTMNSYQIGTHMGTIEVYTDPSEDIDRVLAKARARLQRQAGAPVGATHFKIVDWRDKWGDA